MAAEHTLTIDQGSAFTQKFVKVESDCVTPVVLDGYTGQMMIRRSATARGAPIYDSDDYPNSIIIDGPEGRVTVVISDDVTQTFPAPFVGYYDIELNDGSGVISRLVQGRVTITPNVTREDR